MRWGWRDEQRPNHIGPLKAAITSLYFILKVVIKEYDF